MGGTLVGLLAAAATAPQAAPTVAMGSAVCAYAACPPGGGIGPTAYAVIGVLVAVGAVGLGVFVYIVTSRRGAPARAPSKGGYRPSGASSVPAVASSLAPAPPPAPPSDSPSAATDTAPKDIDELLDELERVKTGPGR